MPTKTDAQKLVYCVATIQEVQRISTVAPTVLPHMSTKDISINGYYFPKGTTFIANLRKYLRDPNVFPDPMRLIPERFIESEATIENQPARLKVCSHYSSC